MKQILFALFILLIICFIFKNKDGFCLNDEDTDQSMLDNIVASCPSYLGVNNVRDMSLHYSHVNDNCLCSMKFLVESCTDDDGNVIDTEMIDRFNNLFNNGPPEIYNPPVTWDWFQDYDRDLGGAQYIANDLHCTKIRGGGNTHIAPSGEDHELCHDKEFLNMYARYTYQDGGYSYREICVADETLQEDYDINYKCKYHKHHRNECVQDPDCLTIQCPNNEVVIDWQPHQSCRDDRIKEIFNNLPDSSGYDTNEICAGNGNSIREECTSITNRRDCIHSRTCDPIPCV